MVFTFGKVNKKMQKKHVKTPKAPGYFNSFHACVIHFVISSARIRS